jgi:hypothetical protein
MTALSKELDEIVNSPRHAGVTGAVTKSILIWFPTSCISCAILRSTHRQRVARIGPTFSPSRSQQEVASSMKLVDQRNKGKTRNITIANNYNLRLVSLPIQSEIFQLQLATENKFRCSLCYVTQQCVIKKSLKPLLMETGKYYNSRSRFEISNTTE